MRRYFPRARELAFLATLAAVCAIIVCLVPSREMGLMVLTFPVAVIAGVMGARRAGLLSPPRAPEPEEVEV